MNDILKTNSVLSEGDVSDFTRFSTENKVYTSSAALALIQRIEDLKSLQGLTDCLKEEFSNGIASLIRSFGERLDELNETRRSIISGEKDRGDGLRKPMSSAGDEAVTTVAREIIDCHVKRDKSGKLHLPLTGVPNFWLTVFKNTWILREVVQPHDEPILSKLEDVRIKYTVKPRGFCLEFHFGENEFFKNPVLAKQYVVDDNPTLKSNFEIIQSTGARISWFPDKNVTIKLGKKRQKHKISGFYRYVNTTVKKASFFNFFYPPVPDAKVEINKELRTQLAMDYELGQYFRTKIVPDAYLYFIGQMNTQDDEDFEDDNPSDSSTDIDSVNSKQGR